MSIPAVSSTTLTNAIDARQTRLVVGSTSGINGVGSLTSPQSAIVIDGEKMLIQSVPISGILEVMRGVDGTLAKAHNAAAVVYYGAKSTFGYTVDGQVGLAGDAGSLPDYRLPLGERRRWMGKEYVLCDFTATVHSGVVVSISNDGLYAAAVLAAGHQGAVGVVAEQTTTSDTWGWVQIYGSASAQDASATSGITSAYVPIVAASVSSPNAGMTALINTTSTAQRVIYGMFITGDATTAVTSAASHTGVALPVFLNYPYVLAVANDYGMS
jgi:hypothetical protein